MRITTWNIDKGGRNKIKEILSVIKEEDSDLLVLTGFRVNHNKESIINGLKKFGYPFFIFNKKTSKHKDTILLATKEKVTVEKYNDFRKDSFLIVKKNDIYIAAMNFTDSISQKDLTNRFINEVSTYKDSPLLIVGNIQTAQNYATPNSLGIGCCKKYMDFNEIGLRNCIVECGYSNNEYTWKARKDCEYNVDFIFANNNIDLTNSYCYYNTNVKKEEISSHCLITLRL